MSALTRNLDPARVLHMVRAAVGAYHDHAEGMAATLGITAPAGMIEPCGTGDTEGFLSSDAECVVVAFRGSQTLGDWIYNASIQLVDWPGGGRVHQGFSAALDHAWPALSQRLRELAPRKHVWFTGHSLGGALAVLAAASCYAVSAITGRVLSRTDSSVSLVFWTTTMMGVGAGVLALPHWVAIAPEHWALILALATTGFLGQLAITEAFRHGQASVVAPFEYTALAWGVGLDWALWRTVPDHYTLLGGAIISASGLYLIRQEQCKVVSLPP